VKAISPNTATVVTTTAAAAKQDGDTASGFNGVAFEDRLLIDDPSGLLLGTGDAGTALHLRS
jgi:hypothetical protein